MASPREREIILNMLDHYKNMPFLWDKTHVDYKNRQRRFDGQLALLDIFKEFEPYATLKTLNKKIQNLRTNYVKELKKVKDSMLSGGPTYVPSVYYFDALHFIGASNESFRSIMDPLEYLDAQATTSPASSDAEIEDESQRTSVSSNFSQPKKRRVTETNVLQNQIFSTAGKLFQHKYREDDSEVMGKSIGIQLRDVDDKQQLIIALKLISDTIYFAKMGQLTPNSRVELGPATAHDSKSNLARSPSTPQKREQ